MKRFFIIIFLTFSVNLSFSQTFVQLCKGQEYTWHINSADTDTIIYSKNENQFDTIIGNAINIIADSSALYQVKSKNGINVYCESLILNVKEITPVIVTSKDVTCPNPYQGQNTPGPWADGIIYIEIDSSKNDITICENRIITKKDSITGLHAGIYNVQTIYGNGCEVTQQVTIQQPPAWGYDTLSTIWETYITCSHEGTLRFECYGGTPPLTWDWQSEDHWGNTQEPIWFGDSIMPYPNTPTISVNTPGQYFLRVIDNHGCRWFNAHSIDFTAYQVLPDTVHLHYYMPEDSVTLIECPESMEVCQYKPFFNALSLGHGTYQWNTEWDTEFGHELDTTQNFTGPYQTGWLNVEFTDQNGCVTRDSVYLDVYDANISITADSIMNDDSVYTVTVSPLGGTLYLDGIEIPIENGTISFDASQYQLGEHDLSYVGEWGTFGCYFDTTFHFTIQHQDGISEFERNTKLWPNPASNTLNIEFNGEFSGDIQLFDMTGRLLKTSEKESEITSIDVSDLTSGVYFIRFVSQNGTFTKKFVKK